MRTEIDQYDLNLVLEWCKPAYAKFVAKERANRGCLDCDVCARFAFNLVTSRLRSSFPKIHFALSVDASNDPEHPRIDVLKMFSETDSMFRFGSDWDANKAVLVARYGKGIGEAVASKFFEVLGKDDDVLRAVCLRAAVAGFKMQEKDYVRIKRLGFLIRNMQGYDGILEYTTASNNKVNIHIGYHIPIRKHSV